MQQNRRLDLHFSDQRLPRDRRSMSRSAALKSIPSKPFDEPLLEQPPLLMRQRRRRRRQVLARATLNGEQSSQRLLVERLDIGVGLRQRPQQRAIAEIFNQPKTAFGLVGAHFRHAHPAGRQPLLQRQPRLVAHRLRRRVHRQPRRPRQAIIATRARVAAHRLERDLVLQGVPTPAAQRFMPHCRLL